MTEDNKTLLKNVVAMVIASAAIAGIAYLITNQDQVKGALAKAKDSAADGLDRVKEGWQDLSETARNKFAGNA